MKNFKILVLVVTVIFNLTSCAPLKTVSVNEPFVKVYIDLKGNQSENFVKANDWMVSEFKNAESVIEYTDKETGTIIGKYLMFGTVRHGAYGMTSDDRIFAKIDIRLKDNRARISIQPMGNWKYDSSGFTIYSYSPEKAQADMESLADRFYMKLRSDTVDF